MLEYQIKFGLCLLLFYLFYKLLLEQQSFHHFKRFYLLLSYTLAAVIPMMTLPLNHKLPPVYLYSTNFVISTEITDLSSLASEAETSFSPVLIIYLFVLAILLFRFAINLWKLLVLTQNSPKIRRRGTVFLLMEEQVTPHTFLNYIFVNKDQYLKNKIPGIVLKHEEAHAIQKHSLDVLAIELVCILFWFNPAVYLFRRPVKLNHEFLADREVLKTGVTRIKYWDALLNDISTKYKPQLVHSFNYSSIKKRLLIMKKQTSRRSALVRQFSVVFLVSIAFYSFSTPATEADNILPLKQSSKITDSGLPKKNKQQTSVASPYNPGASSSVSQNKEKIHHVVEENPPGKSRAKHNDRGPTPSEFVLEMKDQDAVFFYNDQSISPDEAVILIQHSLKIDLVAMHTGLEKPVVELSNAEMPEEYQEILLLYHE